MNWRRHGVPALLGVGVVAAIVSAVPRGNSHDGADIGAVETIQVFVAASDEVRFRATEGRLSGGFRYRPFVASPPEQVAQERKAILRIRIRMSALETAIKRRRTPTLQHALGVGHLLLGNEERAVAEFKEALLAQTGVADLRTAIRRSNDGRLLNDFSVSLNRRGTAEDLRLAIEAAERARTIWRRPESSWNYALALSAIHLCQPAMAGWRHFSEFGNTSEWQAEAKERYRHLAKRVALTITEDPKQRLQFALAAVDPHDARTTIWKSPQQAREWLEESAFPEWAIAHLHQEPAAPLKLARLAEFAKELDRATGDRLLHDHVVALLNARRDGVAMLDDVARAHVAFKQGRLLYERSEFAAARREARRAARVFESYALPFRHVVRLTIASCYYISGSDGLATAMAQSMIDAATERQFAAVAARAHWILGLVTVETGDPREAIAHYRRAIELFASAREVGNEAAATALLAQAQDSVGLTEESWKGRYAAFALHPQVPSARWRHGIFIEAAMAAVRSRDVAVARLLLDQTIAIDLEAHDDLGVAGALRVRSMLHHLLGDAESAAADLATARRYTGRVRDADARASFMTRLDTTAALEMLRRDPGRALQILSATGSTRGTPADVAETTLGLSAAQAGHPGADIRQLIRAIDALEARLTSDDGTLWRSPLIAQPLISLYDEAIVLLAQRDQASDALLLSERARLSVRRLNGYGSTAAANRSDLPADSAALVFYTTDTDVISWSVGKHGIRMRYHRAAAAEMRDLVAAILRTLDQPNSETARRLSTAFLAPHWLNIHGAERLFIVPDDSFWTLPFAALHGPGGRFLAEDFVLELAASLAEQAFCEQTHFERPRRALLVSGTAGTGSDLPALPEARREVTQLQRVLQAGGVEAKLPTSNLALEAAEANAIHFAGHAVPNANDPALSYLVLNSGERLYARDIRQWRLRGRPVVVLSACEAALRPGRHLDAWGSIADAFTHAGAAGVVAATVPIDDHNARAFATSFYTELLKTDPSSALHQVQKAAAAQGVMPKVWAPYVYLAGNCH